VAAGGNCGINATFRPFATGPYSTSLVINDNATGNPHEVTLTGTGVTASGTYNLSVSAGSTTLHSLQITVVVH
jgi:hypothetical protein